MAASHQVSNNLGADSGGSSGLRALLLSCDSLREIRGPGKGEGHAGTPGGGGGSGGPVCPGQRWCDWILTACPSGAVWWHWHPPPAAQTCSRWRIMLKTCHFSHRSRCSEWFRLSSLTVFSRSRCGSQSICSRLRSPHQCLKMLADWSHPHPFLPWWRPWMEPFACFQTQMKVSIMR